MREGDTRMGSGYPTRAVRRRIARQKRRRFFLALLLPAALLAGGWLLGRGAGILRRIAHPGVYVIAVDAGHGGADTGARGVVQESDLTAQTAQSLTDLLAQDARFRVAATRSGWDASATPAERAAAANRSQADLLLSIHGNSDVSADTRGFECYPVPPGSSRHKASMRFAECLAQEMETAGAHLRAENGIRYAYYDDAGSKILVDSSESDVRSQPTFGVLQHADCPAVLAEQCFVTSPADVDAFGDDDGCKTAAGCYYRAICAYFGLSPAAGA